MESVWFSTSSEKTCDVGVEKINELFFIVFNFSTEYAVASVKQNGENYLLP